ncbi:MAG: beta-galactosidase [Bacteroidales bacterium]
MRNIRKSVVVALSSLSLLCGSVTDASAQEQGSFTTGDKTFLLNGEPFIIKAAEMHYPRIPRPYWEHRIQMCKALGMNTICLYVFWNIHEQKEGEFDFTENNDIREFVKLAQKNGMYVIVRPGPYVCAEWEMGGLPWWLLKKKDIKLRDNDPYYMERVAIFEEEVAKQLSDLTIDKGGPVIMVQVENEFGAYATNKPHVRAIRDILRKVGFDKVALFQCDWSSTFQNNGLEDLIWTINFGTGANIEKQFESLSKARPNAPLMCSEFWSGWFDRWGSQHETRNSETMIRGMQEMLDRGISFSLYMTHGGTTWGHWAGANNPPYTPDVTSYDYDAPISESGVATPKYMELRKMLSNYMYGQKQPAIPKAIPVIAIPKIAFNQYAPLFKNLPDSKETFGIKTMEKFDQGWGSIIYSTTAPDVSEKSVMTISDPKDYVQVFVNGNKVGVIDRRLNEKSIVMPPLKKGDRIDILVEAMGRVNFGGSIKDFKGITDKVELSYALETGSTVTIDLKNWKVYNLPVDYSFVRNQNYEPLQTEQGPGFYRATFNLKKPGDTFINMESWGKGLVYVNGYPIGRFWEIGPQQTLYMPGCWLKKGENEIIVFDIIGPKEASVEGLKTHIVDKLNLQKAPLNRKEGENLDLSGEVPVISSSFVTGNGYKEVKFNNPVSGRYICIEAQNTHDGNGSAAIAEWYMLGSDGQRISREPWSVVYCSDEDVRSGNKTAEKIFDLQESTYWSTNSGVKGPHYLVFDLGSEQTLTGFQYLPRVEPDAPQSIKDYKIYVKGNSFRK